jgi:hypothetical protein
MRLNAMQPRDVLLAYGLAAYLMEAKPEHFVKFVRATADRTDAEGIVEDVLGVDLPFLAWRLRRWLLES